MKIKQVILGLAILLNFGTLAAQDLSSSDVPSVVLNAFQTKYRNASDVEWEYKNGYYEVEFEIERRDFEIKYDSKGNILYYEEELTSKQLPSTIQSAITAKYPGFSVREAKKKDSGKVIFEVELKNKSGEEWELVLNPSGKVLTEMRD